MIGTEVGDSAGLDVVGLAVGFAVGLEMGLAEGFMVGLAVGGVGGGVIGGDVGGLVGGVVGRFVGGRFGGGVGGRVVGGGSNCPGLTAGDKADENTGIQVSLPAISSAVGGSSSGSGAVHIAMYNDDRLFKGGAPSAGSAVKSKVLSVSIAGARDSGRFGMLARVSLSFPVQVNSSYEEIASRACSYFGEATSEWLTDGCAVDRYESTENLTVCSCDHLTSFAVLMDTDRDATAASADSSHRTALSIITYIGIGASLVCITITIGLYLYFDEARGMTKTILLNLCACLALSLILFLVAMEAGLSGAACTASAAGLHYFLLAMFCWMLVEGCTIYHTFVTVFDKARSMHPVLQRAAFAYGLPAVVVGVCVGIWPEDYGANDVCWLSSGPGTNNLIWAFIGPAAFVVVVNLVVFVIIFVKIMTFTLPDTGRSSRSSILNLARRKAKRGAKASFSFLTLLGVTWGVGIATTFYPDEVGWQYAFSLFNAFLGVWIFFFQVLTDPALAEAMRAHGMLSIGSRKSVRRGAPKSLRGKPTRKRSRKSKGNKVIRNKSRHGTSSGHGTGNKGTAGNNSFRDGDGDEYIDALPWGNQSGSMPKDLTLEDGFSMQPRAAPARRPTGFDDGASERELSANDVTWVNGAPMMVPASHWDDRDDR